MRLILPLGCLLILATPALAQPFSPISGPNDPIPSPVCDIINFGFCPQPAPPPPDYPDPHAVPVTMREPLPPPPHAMMRHHHRMHRHRKHPS
jgi:hypothetical protein